MPSAHRNGISLHQNGTYRGGAESQCVTIFTSKSTLNELHVNLILSEKKHQTSDSSSRMEEKVLTILTLS